MSLPDTIFILLAALVLFGPKKLPEIARQAGKLLAELRRASNEFKFQMEEELRQAEDADRRKQAEAAPAASPNSADTLTIQPPATGAPVVNRISSRAETPPDNQATNASATENTLPFPEPEAAPHA
jgi:sec-independent protein translocase protein TatB